MKLHLPRLFEPRYVTGIKSALYAVAVALYVWPLASDVGVIAAMIATLFAMWGAKAAHRRHMRTGFILVISTLVGLSGVVIGGGVRDGSTVVSRIGVHYAIVTSDAIIFVSLAVSVVFALRFIAHRVRVCSLLEVLFVVGSVATTLAAHRNRMLNQPRFLADWAWSAGVDPMHVLVVVGTGVGLLAAVMFLRNQPLLKLVTTGLLLALLGTLYFAIGPKRFGAHSGGDVLGLSGKDKRHKRGKNSPGGKSDLFKDNYEASTPPRPVAVGILRDDLSTHGDVIYFRQRALSEYNGVFLSADAHWDHDVITKLPDSGRILAEPAQSPEAHSDFVTTMFLIVDHPQPPALSHATELRLVKNPNPQQFVVAYEVLSRVLSVPIPRLLGHRSIPNNWSSVKVKHYTTIPDDPRYAELATMITRRIDPRFAEDDLAKAYAIKRYLERNGFYTRRSSHASHKDPTASFLFGNLRGYCVHFAHAAVFLLRSMGIASRVALGYAVQTNKRAGGSTILIMSDRAHAWPEIHLESVGWVTFDIYPQQTDMPIAPAIDYDLERMFGEIARNTTQNSVEKPRRSYQIPWQKAASVALIFVIVLVVLGYSVKSARRFASRVEMFSNNYYRLAYLAVLDRFSEIGLPRDEGETREQHALRLARIAPHMPQLTEAHLAWAFGSGRDTNKEAYAALVAHVHSEMTENTPSLRRCVGLANPFSWLRTR